MLKNRIDRAFTALLMAVSPLMTALAQTNLGTQLLESSENSLKQLGSRVVSLIQVIMGLGGMVVLVMIIFKVLKGEREAAEKLAWWIFGLTVGFVLLVVLKTVALG